VRGLVRVGPLRWRVGDGIQKLCGEWRALVRPTPSEQAGLERVDENRKPSVVLPSYDTVLGATEARCWWFCAFLVCVTAPLLTRPSLQPASCPSPPAANGSGRRSFQFSGVVGVGWAAPALRQTGGPKHTVREGVWGRARL